MTEPVDEAVLAHYWGEDWTLPYPDMAWLKKAQLENYTEIMALQKLINTARIEAVEAFAKELKRKTGWLSNGVNPADFLLVIDRELAELAHLKEEK